MPRPNVLLFDIDGTLVLTGGAGRRSMDGAFRRITGKGDVFADFQFGGMTDLGIVRAGLELVGRAFEAALAEEIFETYLSILPREVEHAPNYRVLPGVMEVLDAVADREGVAVGLGTGNIERGARIKIGRAGLSERFAFGGFGSDAEDRTELLRAGAERGAAALGAPLSECRVVIIGDTPKDVSAAKGLGAICVAVGTGGYSHEDLRELGADEAFADLRDDAAISAILGR